MKLTIWSSSKLVQILLLTILVQGCFCITLYPRDSLMRETRSLDGIWNFRISPWWDMDLGFKENWYNHSLTKSGKNEVIPMAVPSSFNDITQNKTIRDFIGWVWYDREFYIPSNWLSNDRSLILRFGSAHYYTQVYVNGVLVVKHEGGHLPFATDISTVVSANKPNRITVAINNTLTPCTVPQGHVVHPSDSMSYPPGYVVQDVNFDFYNYAGIHRSVVLYSIPKLHIEDIIINTDVVSTTGIVSYQIIPVKPKFNCKVVLRDKAGLIAAEGDSCNSQLLIPSAHLWWPWTMNSDPGYLYTLEVQLVHRDESTILDEYHQPVGIRSIQLTNTSFLINNQPFYFTGFGMHEDMNIKGKGLDLAMILKDYNLLKWIGANSFRTSHYPYSEELMDLADELGFVVIDECPAVALHSFEDNLLELHKNMITEMVSRDKNRPSVVMWSVANEPYSTLPESEEYFRQVISHTRELDGYRPITAALSMTCSEDHVGGQLDLVMMNRYYGWYADFGHLDVIPYQVTPDIRNCHVIFNHKLIIMSEYGADTVAGLHGDPATPFTEEFQVEYLAIHHAAFDEVRRDNFFVGELVWNFADFMTMPGLTRVVGNKKGVFTRERQPKAAAHLLRCRYHKLFQMNTDDLYCK